MTPVRSVCVPGADRPRELDGVDALFFASSKVR